MFFFTIIKAFGWISVLAVERTRMPQVQWGKTITAAVLLIVSLVSINILFLNEYLRVRFDATGSRAYTLSEQTQRFIGNMDSPWKIVVLMDEQGADQSSVKQIDEVLRRYDDASELISIQRINPSDPSAIEAYEVLVQELLIIY